MRKLSEIQDEQALDLLADLIDPIVDICSDEELKKLVIDNAKKTDIVKLIIRGHKTAIIEILAALNDTSIKEYHCTVFTLPTQILELLNDKDLMDFFKSQGEMMMEDASGSAMEITTADEK